MWHFMVSTLLCVTQFKCHKIFTRELLLCLFKKWEKSGLESASAHLVYLADKYTKVSDFKAHTVLYTLIHCFHFWPLGELSGDNAHLVTTGWKENWKVLHIPLMFELTLYI